MLNFYFFVENSNYPKNCIGVGWMNLWMHLFYVHLINENMTAWFTHLALEWIGLAMMGSTTTKKMYFLSLILGYSHVCRVWANKRSRFSTLCSLVCLVYFAMVAIWVLCSESMCFRSPVFSCPGSLNTYPWSLPSSSSLPI